VFAQGSIGHSAHLGNHASIQALGGGVETRERLGPSSRYFLSSFGSPRGALRSSGNRGGRAHRHLGLVAQHEVAILANGEIRVGEVGAAENELIVEDVHLAVLHPHHLVPAHRQLALEHATGEGLWASENGGGSAWPHHATRAGGSTKAATRRGEAHRKAGVWNSPTRTRSCAVLCAGLSSLCASIAALRTRARPTRQYAHHRQTLTRRPKLARALPTRQLAMRVLARARASQRVQQNAHLKKKNGAAGEWHLELGVVVLGREMAN
jgi:hypothetical protein